jgi:hypothetical protein
VYIVVTCSLADSSKLQESVEKGHRYFGLQHYKRVVLRSNCNSNASFPASTTGGEV